MKFGRNNLMGNLSFVAGIHIFIGLCKLVNAQTSEHGATTPCTTQCKFAHLIVVHENFNNGIELTTTSSLSTTQISVVFPNESFPEECGATYIRCNLTVLRDEPGNRVVIVIPVIRGAALAMFSMENNTMLFIEQYVLELSLPSYNCHLTNFLNRIESVTGLCFNLSAPELESRTVSYTTLDVNFNNLSLSTFHPSILFLDYLVRDISQTVFFEAEPRCLDDDADHLYAFTIVGIEIAFLHLRNGPVVYEMYHDGQRDRQVVCSSPRRLVRISNSVLVAYCDNTTIELDVCESRSLTIDVKEFRLDLAQGVRYYCSSDKRTYVTEKNGNLTVTATAIGIPPGHTFEIPPDVNGIYIGDCIIVDGQLHFIVTSNDGRTHLIDLRQGSSTLLGESGDIIPHMIYNNRNILYRNGTHSLVYNISCPRMPVSLEVDAPLQLSAYFESDETYPCMCEEPVDTTQTTNDSVTTETINNTTTEPTEPTTDDSVRITASTLHTTTENGTTTEGSDGQGGLSSSLTIVVSVSALLFLVVIVVLITIIAACVIYKQESENGILLKNCINRNQDTINGEQDDTQTAFVDHMEGTGIINSIVKQGSPGLLTEIYNEKSEEDDGVITNSINLTVKQATPGSERKENDNNRSTGGPVVKASSLQYTDPDLPTLETHEPEKNSMSGTAYTSAVEDSDGESYVHQETGSDKNRTVIQRGQQPQTNSYPMLPANGVNPTDGDCSDFQAELNQENTPLFNQTELSNKPLYVVSSGATAHSSENGHVTDQSYSSSHVRNHVHTCQTGEFEESSTVLSGQFDGNQDTTESHQTSEGGDNEPEYVPGRNLPYQLSTRRNL